MKFYPGILCRKLPFNGLPLLIAVYLPCVKLPADLFN